MPAQREAPNRSFLRQPRSTFAPCVVKRQRAWWKREGPTGVEHRPASRCSSKGAASSAAADTMSNMENKTTQITEAAAVVLDTVVRCTETDVNGHLNNAKFVEYLEWGREEWYESQGFGYDHLGELGAITVVVNINLDYRQSCRQGDRLRIVTSPQRRGRSSFALASGSRGPTAPLSPRESSRSSPSIRTRAAPYRCLRSSRRCSAPRTEPACYEPVGLMGVSYRALRGISPRTRHLRQSSAAR